MNIEEVTKRNACTGCGACSLKCPPKCISMEDDEEGFLVPIIDTTFCIDCGICISICPQEHRLDLFQPIDCYGVKHKNPEVLIKSSSGGMFSLLAEEVLRRNGIVFGCALIENAAGYLVAEHIEIDNYDGLDVMRGSKYVQSRMGTTYQKVKVYLESGTWVLFTGTPCEIAGLKSYLGKEYDRLITADLICHGVPSPLLFQKYLEYCSEKVSGKILTFKFRDKSQGKGLYYYYYSFRESGTGEIKNKCGARDRNGYYSAFSRGDTYRESCYQCHYSQNKRIGDVTIGDYFALEFQHPDFDSDGGVSSLLVNTQKGKAFIESTRGHAKWLRVNLDDIVMYSSNLQRPSTRTDNRDIAYTKIHQSPREIFESEPFRISAKDKLVAIIKEHAPTFVVQKIRAYVFQKNVTRKK